MLYNKTCTNYEKIVSECEYCGYVHKEINEKKGLGEHVFVKVNHKEPTCTEEGYSYDLKCSECGEINNDGNQEAGQTIPSIHSNLSGSNIITNQTQHVLKQVTQAIQYA